MGSGGKERRLNELIKYLSQKPEYTLALVVFRKIFHFKDVEDASIKIYELNKTARSMATLKPFRQFGKICDDFKPDLIHSWGNLNSLLAIPAARFRGIPIVNNQITSIAKSKGGVEKFLFYKLPFAFSRIIVGNSKTGLASYSVQAAKARCIYNGFNLNRLNNLRLKEEVRKELGIATPLVVGMVASTVPAKDYQTFFDSAVEVLKTRDDVSFVAIGKGVKKKYAPNIQQKHASRILLFKARKQIENDMNVFDIGVLSSFYEGLPNVVLEMMALGKAVIASDVGGTAELIDDGKDGFLFTTGDKEKLVQLINLLLDDNSSRGDIGSCAKEKVQMKFDINRMLSEYESVFQEAIEKK